jgi:hypothetical protein
MHPPERGLGQKPRNQRPERERDGNRPLLQGHLKASKRRPTVPSPEPAPPPPTAKAAKRPPKDHPKAP